MACCPTRATKAVTPGPTPRMQSKRPTTPASPSTTSASDRPASTHFRRSSVLAAPNASGEWRSFRGYWLTSIASWSPHDGPPSHDKRPSEERNEHRYLLLERQRSPVVRAGVSPTSTRDAHRPDGVRQDTLGRAHGSAAGTAGGHHQLP